MRSEAARAVSKEQGGTKVAENEITRGQAMEILKQYVKEESLLRHCVTVEAVMRHFAPLYGGDSERWGVIGLLHDVDFELYPKEHCKRARELLCAHGVPEDVIRAVESHGYGLVCDVEPRTDAEKVLYAIDELTGLISATARMHPSRSVLDLEVKSVKKKWKQKGFAAAVSRDVIAQGAERLGMPLDELIAQTIAGMQAAADEIGLRGEL